MAWEREIELSRRIAIRAGEIAREHAARGVSAEHKADDSPVTEADRAVEAFVVSALQEAFPDDGLLGEEGARAEGRSGRRWIIDPIDGTRDFLRGLPGWSSMLALEAEDEVVVGVCNLAALGELYWAAKGHGAWLGNRRVRTSTIDRRDRAVLCVSTVEDLVAHPILADRTRAFLPGFWAVRSMSGCFDAMLVASGRAEAWIELKAASWDLAPLQIIGEEAGARFFNFDGGRSPHAGNCVICAPGLEADLRRFVGAPA
jgi:histidinol phosphatase-like enzyme (inositol monophosphatase family)